MLTTIEFLHRLPKMELHIHLEGAIQPATALALAQKNGVVLPPFENIEDLYHYQDLKEFLAVYTAVSSSMLATDDFRRTTYEMLEKCAADNARYVEFFFSPQVHLPHCVSFDTQIDGIIAGMDEAKTDFGIDSRIVPGVNRELGPAAGGDLLDMILARKEDRLIGIGLDFNEQPFPPEPYAGLFARARKSGLNVTAHAGEGGPAAFVAGSIDALGVRRIDHGYNTVNDPDLMQRAKDLGVLFTVCPSTSAVTSPFKDLSAPDNALHVMSEFGLKIMLNSDDPPMFGTDLGMEYQKAQSLIGFKPAQFRQMALDSIDGSWLDQGEKQRLTTEWSAEIDTLIAALPMANA